MALKTTELRGKLYRVLDQVAATGEPVEIERRGKTLQIVLASPVGKMDRLVTRTNYLRTKPDEIVHLDWSDEWRP